MLAVSDADLAADIGGISLDRDHKLRVVGADAPASVSRAALPSHDDKPPEHASPEAMLRWARAQRSNKKLAPETGRIAKKSQKEFVSLAFAAPGKSNIEVASESVESAPLTFIRKKGPLKLYVIVGSIALALAVAALTGIYSGGAVVFQPVLSPSESESAVNGDLKLSVAPNTHLVGDLILTATENNFVNEPIIPPSVGPIQRSSLATLASVAQIAEPEIQVIAPGDVVYVMPAATKFDGIDTALTNLNVPQLAKFVPPTQMPNLVAGTENAGQFVPPPQYSRKDLGSGVGDLLSLITGQVKTQDTEISAKSDVFLATRPLIFVHHGLGVSPETVRRVMQKLASNGYESIYQVGVPFRIGRTNVRFYHPSDMNLAQEIAGAVIPLVDGPQFSEPRDFSRYSKPPRAGTIDIWLSDKA